MESNQINEIHKIIAAEELEMRRNEVIDISDDEDIEMERNVNGEWIQSTFFVFYFFSPI